MSEEKNNKPRFDIYPLLSRWDFWLAVVFILVVLAMLVIYMLPAPQMA